MNRKYAGIGSRTAPENILEIMAKIARELAIKGWTLRSGRAQGADQAFEYGCDTCRGQKEIFLPWPSFPGAGHYDYTEPFSVPNVLLSGPTDLAIDLCRQTLGSERFWGMPQSWQKLHARNVHQVLGAVVDDPVDCVICWAPPMGPTKVKGGTNTAWQVARNYKVKCYNLYHTRDRDEVMSLTI